MGKSKRQNRRSGVRTRTRNSSRTIGKIRSQRYRVNKTNRAKRNRNTYKRNRANKRNRNTYKRKRSGGGKRTKKMVGGKPGDFITLVLEIEGFTFQSNETYGRDANLSNVYFFNTKDKVTKENIPSKPVEAREIIEVMNSFQYMEFAKKSGKCLAKEYDLYLKSGCKVGLNLKNPEKNISYVLINGNGEIKDSEGGVVPSSLLKEIKKLFNAKNNAGNPDINFNKLSIQYIKMLNAKDCYKEGETFVIPINRETPTVTSFQSSLNHLISLKNKREKKHRVCLLEGPDDSSVVTNSVTMPGTPFASRMFLPGMNKHSSVVDVDDDLTKKSGRADLVRDEYKKKLSKGGNSLTKFHKVAEENYSEVELKEPDVSNSQDGFDRYQNFLPTKLFKVEFPPALKKTFAKRKTHFNADKIFIDFENETPTYIAATCPKEPIYMNNLISTIKPKFIFMVTGVMELSGGRCKPKCTKYYLNERSDAEGGTEGSTSDGKFVKYELDKTQTTPYILEIRKVQVKESDKEGAALIEGDITHYHYKKWRDFGVPKESTPVTKTGPDGQEKPVMAIICGEEVPKMVPSEDNLYEEQFLRMIKDSVDYLNKKFQSVKRPILVHCSAGIGRTGTFIMIVELTRIYLKFKDNGGIIEYDEKHSYSFLKDLYINRPEDRIQILCKLLVYFRIFRMGFIQTPEQFNYVREYFDKLIMGKFTVFDTERTPVTAEQVAPVPTPVTEARAVPTPVPAARPDIVPLNINREQAQYLLEVIDIANFIVRKSIKARAAVTIMTQGNNENTVRFNNFQIIEGADKKLHIGSADTPGYNSIRDLIQKNKTKLNLLKNFTQEEYDKLMSGQGADEIRIKARMRHLGGVNEELFEQEDHDFMKELILQSPVGGYIISGAINYGEDNTYAKIFYKTNSEEIGEIIVDLNKKIYTIRESGVTESEQAAFKDIKTFIGTSYNNLTELVKDLEFLEYFFITNELRKLL